MSEPKPLSARGLHRFYRRGDTEVAALLDVSLTCAPGETVAVVGPSGSGKSTLISLLAGLDDPDGGSVQVYGSLLSHQGPTQAARLRARHIGTLTQHSALLGQLSVRDNVLLAASLRSRARGARRQPAAVDELIDALGLVAVRHSLPRQLSGGETARAGLASALAGQADVLLADEPTAEVSASEEASVLDLIQRWRPPHGATVLVTHSAVVSAAADRVLHLRDGRSVAA
ncbi:MAG: putative transport system ATP-binding protein [Frankiaceae bacterium]|jgi:putative ABC transport system ATP-binding protein|nr:putative transport system ATP-binding protein [Frankiaceae bacterium]